MPSMSLELRGGGQVQPVGYGHGQTQRNHGGDARCKRSALDTHGREAEVPVDEQVVEQRVQRDCRQWRRSAGCAFFSLDFRQAAYTIFTP